MFWNLGLNNGQTNCKPLTKESADSAIHCHYLLQFWLEGNVRNGFCPVKTTWQVWQSADGTGSSLDDFASVVETGMASGLTTSSPQRCKLFLWTLLLYSYYPLSLSLLLLLYHQIKTSFQNGDQPHFFIQTGWTSERLNVTFQSSIRLKWLIMLINKVTWPLLSVKIFATF